VIDLEVLIGCVVVIVLVSIVIAVVVVVYVVVVIIVITVVAVFVAVVVVVAIIIEVVVAILITVAIVIFFVVVIAAIVITAVVAVVVVVVIFNIVVVDVVAVNRSEPLSSGLTFSPLPKTLSRGGNKNFLRRKIRGETNVFENKLFLWRRGNNLLDKLQKFHKKNKTPDDCFPSLNNYDSFFLHRGNFR